MILCHWVICLNSKIFLIVKHFANTSYKSQLNKRMSAMQKTNNFSLARYIFRTLKRKSLKRKFGTIMTRILLLQAIKCILQAWLYLFSLTEQRQVREKSNVKILKGNYSYIQFIFYQNAELEPKIELQMQKSHMQSICFQNDSVCVNNVHFRRCSSFQLSTWFSQSQASC